MKRDSIRFKGKAANDAFKALSGQNATPYTKLERALMGEIMRLRMSPNNEVTNLPLLLRVLDYARMHIETASLPLDHPLSIAVRDYYDAFPPTSTPFERYVIEADGKMHVETPQMPNNEGGSSAQ